MDSATATLAPDTYSVVLTAIAPVGPVSWARVVGGTETALGSGDTLRDHPPLNLEATYIATDSATTEVAGPVTVTATGAVLNATDRNQAEPVVVVKQPPLQWEARSTTHKVLSRRDPVVIIALPTYATGQLVLLLDGRDQRQRMLDLFDTGAPMLLRTDRPQAVDDMQFLPLSWADPLLSESLPGGRRLLEIEYQAVSDLPPAWAPDPMWSYDEVLAGHADYTALLAAYATYTDLTIGPLP
jgi:hypothetical protein